MNLNKYLLIGTLSVIATNALAEGQNIMTSKSYVDAQDALKQDNIPARATKINNTDTTFAPSVVTNTADAGTVDQMAIITGARMSTDNFYWDDYSNNDSLIPTLGAVGQEISNIWNHMPDISGLQTKIPARATKINNSDTAFAPSVVTNTTTAGSVGQMGILTYEYMVPGGLDLSDFDDSDDLIPTAKLVAQEIGNIWDNMPDISGLQTKIPAGTNGYLATHSGTAGTFGTPVNPATFQSAIDASEWQYGDGTLIPGVVIATGTDGVVAQRMILDKTQDITNTSIRILVNGDAQGIEEDIHDSSVGTADINSAVPTTTMTVAIAKAAAKMTCAGWPDSVPVADRTDANCWLWNKN